jgi:hypothetical protein
MLCRELYRAGASETISEWKAGAGLFKNASIVGLGGTDFI